MRDRLCPATQRPTKDCGCDYCRTCSYTDLIVASCGHCRGDDQAIPSGSDSRRFQEPAAGVPVWPRSPETPTYVPRVEPAATNDPVVKVRRNLQAILDMVPLLDERGEDLADDQDMPGGDAVATSARVASPKSWQRRWELIEAAWMRDQSDATVALGTNVTASEKGRPAPVEDEWEPPLQTLLFWSEAWRNDLDMDYGLTPTIASEANFLANPDVLAWAREHETHWDNFAADMADACTRMENVVREGIRTTRSRIMCDRCSEPERLNVLYGPGAGGLDGYISPCCHQRFTPDEARRALARQLRSQGAERWVTQREAVGALTVQGWQERRVMRWLEPLRPRDRCEACNETWPAGEYVACPRKTMTPGGFVDCGGILEREHVGDREAVVESYCEVGTRRTLVWWPSLWSKHLVAAQKRLARGKVGA